MNKQDNKNLEKKVFMGKKDEEILVIKRDTLFNNISLQGLMEINFSVYQDLIEKNKEFIWRSQAETDEKYKQIIPYLIFKFQDKFFLMQRKKNASEVRLQNKYSLGIGGHIRLEDISSKTIFDWSIREFNEEIFYSGNLKITPIGLLNDDGDSVGKVHVGFVILIEGDSADIKIRDEHKDGNLLTLKECGQYYDNMENWSKIIFDFLKK